MAGTLQNASLHDARMQMRRVRVKYAGADSHTSRTFTACPWKICVAAFASPLFVAFIRKWCGRRRENFLSVHLVGIFVSHASRASLVLYFSFIIKRTYITMKNFLVVCGAASCFAIREQRGAAEGATQNCAGIPVLASHAPGVRRRAVRADRSLFARSSSYPLPGPAPG